MERGKRKQRNEHWEVTVVGSHCSDLPWKVRRAVLKIMADKLKRKDYTKPYRAFLQYCVSLSRELDNG